MILHMIELCIEFNNPVEVIIIKEGFGHEKMALPIGDSSSTNRKIFTHLVLFQQGKRLGIVNMHKVLVSPCGITTTHRNIDLALHTNDTAVMQSQLRPCLDEVSVQIVLEELLSVLHEQEFAIRSDTLLSVI